MKVAALIEELQKLDRDLECVVMDQDGMWCELTQPEVHKVTYYLGGEGTIYGEAVLL